MYLRINIAKISLYITPLKVGFVSISLLLSACALSPTDQQRHSADQYPPNTPLPSALVKEYNTALTLLEDGQTQKVMMLLEKLHQEYPAYSGAAVNLSIMWEQDDPEKAKTYLLEAIERQPKNFMALNRLGAWYRRANDFEKSAQMYTRAVDNKPDYHNAWFNLAILREVYLGDHEGAIGAYEKYQNLIGARDPKIDKRIKRLHKKIEKKNGIGS